MSALLTTPTSAPQQQTRGFRSLLQRVSHHVEALPTAASVVIFVGMLVYGEIAYGRILQASTLSNLLINNAHLILLAVGLTFVILT